jgi:uncharacterized delta-60 repeat protein
MLARARLTSGAELVKLRRVRRGVVQALVVGAALLGAASALALPGDLDSSFGAGGLVTTDFASSSDEANALTAQYGGKLVAAGLTGNDFGLVRYNADGSVDMSFGNSGKVDTSFSVFAQAIDVIKLPSNDLVAAGSTGDGDFALARYQKDGSLDPSFDGDGQVKTSFGASIAAGAAAVVRQTDNKLVAGGVANDDFALARYKKDGSLDSTFGTGGLVGTQVGANRDEIHALLLQGDGKIVAAGVTFDAFATGDFALARYNTDGTLDSSFGTNGIVTTDFNSTSDRGLAAVLQADGKIVVAGESGNDVALARYNPDGTLDSTFGTGGKVTTDFGIEEARASAVGLDSAGNIVAAGTFFTSPNEFLVLRYTPGGALDSTFGSGGEAFTAFPGTNEAEGAALVLQSDGKIVVAGQEGTLGSQDFALARFKGR